MPVHTLLIVGLKGSYGNLILEPLKNRLKVIDFSAGAWGAWVDAVEPEVGNSLPTAKKIRNLIGRVHVECPRSDVDGLQLLKEGAKISLFIDSSRGRQPFWEDTVTDVRTTVRF